VSSLPVRRLFRYVLHPFQHCFFFFSITVQFVLSVSPQPNRARRPFFLYHRGKCNCSENLGQLEHFDRTRAKKKIARSKAEANMLITIRSFSYHRMTEVMAYGTAVTLVPLQQQPQQPMMQQPPQQAVYSPVSSPYGQPQPQQFSPAIPPKN
jgi:hypothetical protein